MQNRQAISTTAPPLRSVHTGSSLQLIYDRGYLSEPLSTPKETVAYLRNIWDTQLMNIQEQVYMLYLNNNNQVISWRCLNTGCCNETLFDIKLAMSCALGCLANKIVLAHNHPSGNLNPSGNDIAVTKKLKMACDMFDIKLIDHIILTNIGYYSFLNGRL